MWAPIRAFICWLLRFGRLPKHVAIIMDGNRRFASQQRLDYLGGHSMGYSKLVEVIHWCLDLGVPEISVYAFSIANFQRTKQEVDGLMNLSEVKYQEMMQETGMVNKLGVFVRILGNLTLVPESVQIAAAHLMTHCHQLGPKKKAILNICFSYTSSEELCQAVSAVHKGISLELLDVDDVDETLIESCLYTSHSPQVDLLIRTSGETRLSDFLLWQSRRALLVFSKVLWPDYSFSDFTCAIMKFQQKAQLLDEIRSHQESGGS